MKKKVVALMTIVTMALTPMAANAGNGSNLAKTFNPLMYFNSFIKTFIKTTADNTADINDKTEAPVLSMTYNYNNSISRTMKFEWTRIDNVTKYEIQRATKEDFSDAVTTDAGKHTSLTYRTSSGSGFSYPAHATYYVRVRAIVGNNVGEWSNTVVSKAIN